MLCSYGRLLTSSPFRRIRLASTVIAVESETATKKPRRPRLPKIDTKPGANVGLVERQASLEASLQTKVKSPVKRRRKSNAEADSSAEDAAEVVLEEDATASNGPDRLAKKEDTPGLEAQLHAEPKKPATWRRRVVAYPDGAISGADMASEAAASKPVAKRRNGRALAIPPRLLPPNDQKHHDLPSFLEHASRNDLNVASTVYRGTYFEYTVASTLQALNFTLQRTGRSNDLGIDLIGHWSLPTGRKKKTYDAPVIVQCKAARPTPSMIRELEGAYTGAPAGWRGDGVLALLANVHPTTKGVREAVQRSRWPLGVLQVTREGEVKQFLWNAVAAEAGLEGLGVALRYASKRGGLLQESDIDEEEEGTARSIGLTWLGKPWRPTESQSAKQDAAATRALLKS